MRRRRAFIGIVVSLAISAAACGSGGGDAAVSIKTLRAAVTNTQAAESSRFTIDVAVRVAGQDLTIEGSGVSSGDGTTTQLTLTVPIIGSVEVRIVDGVIYVNLGEVPLAASRLPEGKHWVRIDPDSLGAGSGVGLGQLLEQAKSNSPTQGLEYLRGLSGDVQNLGDDTVAGAHATHYRASIDYAKVAAKLPDSASALAGKLATLGTVPADVWIDDSDRVVKMHFTISGGALGGSELVDGDRTADFTMEITDFGVPVNVEAPPADETVDVATLGAQTV